MLQETILCWLQVFIPCLKAVFDSAGDTDDTVCALQTMPTDMRALQDFEEEDKLQITMNDVITIIEGRSVCDVLLARTCL